MSVSLYDLLDVDEHATAEEIRAAWRSAIADLDPSDRRFRAYNDAAAVLLDDDKRAAYDAELAAARDDEPVAAPVEEPVEEPAERADEEPAAPAAVPPAAPGPVPAAATESAGTTRTTGTDGPPVWALGVAVAAAVVSLALLIVVLTWPGSVGGESPADRADHAEEVERAGGEAESFAAEAIPVVLSYDYRTLDADFAEAEEYLTDEFAAQRSELFDQETEEGLTLREQVVRDKVVVTAAEAGHGLTRVSDDGDRATVVVFVNQDSQRGKQAPRSLRMWATLNVVKVDGEWRLDDLCTEGDCE